MSFDDVFIENSADFALDLFRQVSKGPENVVFSPTSITLALALAQQGAQGKTRSQISERLFGNLKDDQVEQSLAKLSQTLNQEQQGLLLDSANRLFIDDRFKILDAYLQESRRIFQAEPENVPFGTDSKKAVDRINKWVREKTHDKIEKLFEQLDSSTKLVIANAVYFKGDWANQFEESKTKKSDFHVNNQKTIQLDFMNSNRQFNYWENDQMQMLIMPYVNDQLQMVFMLPKERFGLAKLEMSLKGTALWRGINSAHQSTVIVSLPKFKMETTLGLVDSLKRLGMDDMFLAGKADFSRISADAQLCVSDVQHKAYLEVNEKGSEAAAVTGIVMAERCLMPTNPKTYSFIADQPFLFSIVERANSSVLFFGHFMVDLT